MKRYTKDGMTFYKAGQKVGTAYCVSEAWLVKNGYLPYEERREDGTDGDVNGVWTHYLGAPYVAPEPEPYVPTEAELLEQARSSKLQAIEAYDTSSSVNGFTYNEQTMWIDKATRVGLVNAANAEKALGNSEITVGIGGLSITLGIDALIGMLYQLESYALKCYNVTLRHKNEVEALGSIDEINAYDITEGYPEQLTF